MKIHHVCIQTNNYEESLEFYKNVLNFSLIEETENFNNRSFNTWLDLNGFMIELQTGKNNERLSSFSDASEGIAHFCLYSDCFDKDFLAINSNILSKFKVKNGNKIYNIGSNRLFKVIAPEGTIIEVRDTNAV
ncbi:VOC family protein [Vibrio rotiferianus]|uniref:VOC family protein n=1 Tax=Vibrio rotiferianus TaxID=190895 RepID=A0A7Y4E4A0_9VIBR|nr:VOC family protein [Vibrio rotiferianus]NOH51148.1 VOC family protein [Vibrio rotiferianus]